MANKYPVEIDGITGEVDSLPHAKGRCLNMFESLNDRLGKG